jgi:hypothetical protein
MATAITVDAVIAHLAGVPGRRRPAPGSSAGPDGGQRPAHR